MKGSDLAAVPALFLSALAGDRGRLERWRDTCLRALVRHAYREVPYYRRLLDGHGVAPESVRGVGDLERLPVSSREDLQAGGAEELVARRFRPERLITRRTTGSTGRPLEIRRTWSEERLLGALRWRALRSMGARARDRYAEIEEPLADEPNDARAAHSIVERLGLYRQERLDALAAPPELLRRLGELRPDVIAGYAGVLARLADVGRAEQLERVRPRLVAVHSDTSTPRMRAAIEAAFRAPVHEIYDCNEVNVVAWHCRDTGALHLADDSVIVEIRVGDRPAAPGERGEVLLTSLHSRAMPFLRYRIGDLAVQGDPRCECGRPFSTIRSVVGRMFDYFPLANGRVVHPYEIIAVLERSAPWLARYRITQVRRDRVVLELVARAAVETGVLEAIRAGVERLLEPGVAVEVRRVDDLELEGSAKLRVCRSLVTSEYDALDRTPSARSDGARRH